jgi:hypothetical protein
MMGRAGSFLLCRVRYWHLMRNLGAHSRFAVVKSQVLPGIQRAYIMTGHE